jgi:hypothetical protein
MAAAHVIGISLKTKLDRSRPQTKLVSVILSIVVGLLITTSTILFDAVRPIIDTKGIIETDLFPDLKYNFFITAGFIMVIIVLGIVILRL